MRRHGKRAFCASGGIRPRRSHTVALRAIALVAVIFGGVSAVPLRDCCAEEVPRVAAPRDHGAAFSEYTIGVFLLESDAPTRAIPHLEVAWLLSAHDPTIGHALAEAYYQVGDLAACNEVVAALLENEPDDQAALLLEARMLHLTGDAEGALQRLLRLRQVGPPSFEVERLIGRIQIERGMDDEALIAYENAVRIDPGYPFIHHRYGLLLQRFGRLAEAERAFRTAVELFPEYSDAVVDLARLLVADGRFEDADAVLSALLSREGEFAEALFMAANLYAELGRNERAIDLLEERRPQLTRRAVVLLGRLYYDTGRYDDAFTTFETLYHEEKPTAELARVLGEVSLKGGHPERALHYYREAIGVEPSNFRNYLALFFVSSDQFRERDEYIIELQPGEIQSLLDDAAARVGDDDLDGLYVVGIAYQAVDDYVSSRRLLERALKLAPEDHRVLLGLAGVLEKLGRYADAETHIVKLHGLRPDDPAVCNFYGYLLTLMEQDLDKAEQLIRTALLLEPDNGYYVDSLGWLYYVRGNYRKAVEQLEKASELAAGDPVILEHLGDAYWSLQSYRKALAAYEKSLDLRGQSSEILEKIQAARNQLGD